MRHARALLPYAVTGLVVVAASAAALGLAVADLRDAREAAVDRPSATPGATPRAFLELSRSGRLAYWRPDTSGTGGELQVANLDGTLRRALARAATVRRIGLTRWTPDGESVAYVENGATLVVARLDGTRAEITLPDDARALGGRITDHRWTADGSMVAASVVRADLRSDVYLAAPADRAWVRGTTLDDVFVSQWVDAQHLLVHTGGGIIGLLRAGALNGIRPLSGLPATSPILADDGRVHFLSGTVTSTPRDLTLPHLTASGATVWSIGLDGAEPRRETQNPLDDVRLAAPFGAGRYLAHRGSSQLQIVLSEMVIVPAIEAGPAERVVVSPDGRSAIGFSSSRIIRFDLARGAGTGTLGPATVMLDSVAGGDVWHPGRGAALAGAPVPSAGERPAARYAFGLGGHFWSMDADGVASFLRPRTQQIGRRPPPPAWSPMGDRLLALQLVGGAAAGGSGSGTPMAVTIDTDGSLRTYTDARAATATPTWSPEGDAFAVVVDRRGIDGASPQAELEVRFFNVTGSVARAPIRARDAAWTRGGVLLLTDAALELSVGGAMRTVIALERILADPRGGFAADRSSVTFASLAATPDGALASLRVAVTPRSGASQFAIALIRIADGSVAAFLPGSALQDVGWSPAGSLLGATLSVRPEISAEIRDGRTAAVIATRSGRFAGWSPDGAWYYISRPEGLVAYRVAGGPGVRVSAIGVAVSTTAP